MSGARPAVPVIFNPLAFQGQARQHWPAVAQALAGLRVRYDLVEVADLPAVAPTVRELLRAGAPVVAAAGGDGTVRECAAALAGTGVPLAVLPLGIGNGTSYSLGLPTSPEAAVMALVRGVRRRVDLATAAVAGAAGRSFLNVAGAGLDAEVAGGAKRLPYLKGIPAYVVTTLNSLHSFEPFPVRVEVGGRAVSRTALLVAVGNGGYYGRGVRILPHARPDDGLLDVGVVEAMSPVELAAFLGALVAGRADQHARVWTARGRQVRIETGSAALVQLDGDVVGSTPAAFEAVPGALEVLVPEALSDRR